jgi:hypothetical protein
MTENMNHNFARQDESGVNLADNDGTRPSESWMSQPGLEDWSGTLFYQTARLNIDMMPFERVSNLWELLGRGAVGGTVMVIAESGERAVLKLLSDSFGERGVRQWLMAPNDFIGGKRPIDAFREKDSKTIWAAAEAALAGYYE